MNEVKRFRYNNDTRTVCEHPNGEMVTYKNHLALQRERDELKKKLDETIKERNYQWDERKKYKSMAWQAKAERDELQAIVDLGVEVAKLMDHSTGINGIHLNGEEYAWDEDEDVVEFRRLIHPYIEAAKNSESSQKGGEG